MFHAVAIPLVIAPSTYVLFVRCPPDTGTALAVIVHGKVAFPSDANEVVFLHANHHCKPVYRVIPPSVVRYKFSQVLAGKIPILVCKDHC